MFGKGQFDDIDFAARQLFPDRPELIERSADAALRAGAIDGDRDRHVLERLLVGTECTSQLFAGRGDHFIVVGIAELEEDRSVVLPFDILAGEDWWCQPHQRG